jgi:replicative DNA helicase
MNPWHAAALSFLSGPLYSAWAPDEADVDADSFVVPEHREIWEAENAMHRRGARIGEIALRNELIKRGAKVSSETMTAICAKGPSRGAAEFAGLMREGARRIRLAETMRTLAQQLVSGVGDTDDLVAEAEAAVYAQARPTAKTAVVEMQPAIVEAIKRIEARYKNPGRVWGVPSGLTKLDELTGGFRAGELIVIGARPGIGKTSLGQNIAAHAALTPQDDGSRRGVLTFSLEMGASELAERWLGMVAEVDSYSIRTGAGWNDAAFRRLAKAQERLAGVQAPIIDTTDLTPTSIRSAVRGVAARMERQGSPLGLVVVDYMQLVRGADKRGQSNREQEIAGISRALKEIAKEQRVPVIALSQLNREVEKRPDSRPRNSDLRESGSLEQDADLIIFIHKPPRLKNSGEAEDAPDLGEPELVELIVSKQRAGPIGTVPAIWRGDLMRFEDAP